MKKLIIYATEGNQISAAQVAKNHVAEGFKSAVHTVSDLFGKTSFHVYYTKSGSLVVKQIVKETEENLK